MKYFTHPTDAHRRLPMQVLKKRFGMAGVGRFWMLVDLCLAQTKANGPCSGTFNASELRSLLNLDAKSLKTYLRFCTTKSKAFAAHEKGHEVEIIISENLGKVGGV